MNGPFSDLRIDCDGPLVKSAKVSLDGKDISHKVTRICLDMAVGEINRASIEVMPGPVHVKAAVKLDRRFVHGCDPIWWHPRPDRKSSS